MECKERNYGAEMNYEEEMCSLKWDYDLRCGEYTLNLNENINYGDFKCNTRFVF